MPDTSNTLNRKLEAYATSRRKPSIPGFAADVNILSNYLACSAETSSELVVLIRSGENIHGQIDLDSHEIAAFDDAIEGEVQKVADFLARHYEGWPVSRAT